MSEKYNIEELIIRFLQQDINEEELHYLESWLEEDVEHKSYFFGLKSISDSSRRSFFSKEEKPCSVIFTSDGGEIDNLKNRSR